MKYIVLVFSYALSSLAYAGICNAEIEKATSGINFGQIIGLIEKESDGYDTFTQSLRAIEPVVDLRRDNQFYLSNGQFKRKTVNLNGDALEGEFAGLYFSGTSSSSSPFGLFISFDNKSCKVRSVSYDVPL
ncbi:hypothetical protein [Marinomonas ostreistagni]|uniref:Uncharacterized protein n=1 Tax=Marinomonas ostreistagni TaxID=359209 RepID=A0ABS0ZDC1_9GAMM|nr:hypothetical protein [Marinomonas ostreistagni]MBJ7551668.1 hypothetical protein [Marinomonas ostreistagni]